MSRPTISLCMIVRNEEESLPGCLESVRGLVDEIIVVDTGSVDDTVRIAESFGARVYSFLWTENFAAARNESISRASGDWIFYLDADERLVTDGCADCLRQTVSRRGVDAWSVNIRNYKFGTDIFDNTLNIRLFRRLPDVMFENEVHERVEPSLLRGGATIRKASFAIDHFGYKLAPESLEQKLERNLVLSARHLEREPDDPYCLYYVGVTLLLLRRYGESRPYLLKALGARDLHVSLNAMLCNLVAYLSLMEGKADEALAFAEKSRELVPTQNTSILLRGLAYFGKSDYTQAQPLLERARDFLRRPPRERRSDLSQEYAFIDDAEFLRLIGVCQAKTGHDAEAVTTFKEYMALPDTEPDPVVLKHAGICRVNTGDYAAGLRFLEQAEAQGVARPELVLSMALAYARLRQPDRARTLLEEARANSPRDRKAESKIEELIGTGNDRVVSDVRAGFQQALGESKGIKKMASPPIISVCMIVKNESENMADALACFTSFADEIVVVDTGSVDGTRDIAAKFTPHVYDFEWIDDFSAARNFAMSKATGKYQIWLDADDRITPENQGYINQLKSQCDGRKAFYFVLENHQADTVTSSCLQLRCTPLIPELCFTGRIHEQLFPNAVKAGVEFVTTDIVIQHHGYMTPEMRKAKARRNLAMLERERDKGGEYSGVYFYLSITHASLGDLAEAKSCMLKALDLLNREDLYNYLIPEGYIFLAKLSQETNDVENGIRYLVKAKSFVNGSPSHNYQIGILFQRMGRHDQAINCFREAGSGNYTPELFPTQSPPDTKEVLLHMAYSHFCRNDNRTALKLIQESVMAGGSPAGSWEWMGRKALAFENLSLAQTAFETAQRFGEMEPRSWAHLASIYKMRGFREKAEECLRHM
ncbi:MAG: glycosyltransferase [Syntrophobacter sp.]